MRDFWRGQASVGGVRLALHRLERPLRVRRAPAVRVDQLRHRPRRLHAARPRLLQRQAQRGQPRGQPRRHRRQPLVELRRRGRRPTTPRSSRCARASSATSSRRCCSRQGVPMLLGGDEFGRTQGGNNNAWCQDNEISWFDWELRRRPAGELLDFTRRLIALRRDHPVFRRARLPARARAARARACPTSWWFRPDGRRMTQRDWQRRDAHVARRVPQRRGDRRPHAAAASAIVDDSFLLLFNAHHEDVTFTLPARRFGARVGARAVARPTRTLEPGSDALRGARRGARARRARSMLLRRAA